MPVPPTTPPVATPPALDPPDDPPPIGPIDIPPIEPHDDVLYVQPQGLDRTLVELDWSGLPRSTLLLDQDIQCCGMPRAAPDGSHFGLGTVLYSSAGVRGPDLWFTQWGDDNVHLCDLIFQHYGQAADDPYALALEDLTGHELKIANLPAEDKGTVPFMGACSVRHDRAVVFMNNMPNRRVVIVRLSDGQLLAPPNACVRGYQVTADGRFLVSANNDGTASICDLDSGANIGTLPTQGALTGDGSESITTRVDACGWYHEFVLTDWRTQHEIWSSSSPGYQVGCQQGYGMPRYRDNGDIALQVATLNTRDPGPVFIAPSGSAPHLVAPDTAYAVFF